MAINIDINSASAEEIIAANIPQVGKKIAEEIVSYRNTNGPFSRWEDLKQIPGISDDMINNLRQHATLESKGKE